MHIMIGNNFYPPFVKGGAELIVTYLAEGLAARGHKVTVVSTCGPEMEPYPEETRNGVEVLRFFPKNVYWNWEQKPRRPWTKALWHMRDSWNHDMGAQLDKLLSSRGRPDVLHTHLIDGMSPITWQRAKQAGMRVVHTAHDYHLICPRSLMLTLSQKICTDPTIACQVYRGWQLHTTRYLDLFCSPSKFLIQKHLDHGLRARNTEVVANGIPLPRIERTTRPANKPVRFLFPARHVVEKGCLVLLEALDKLAPDLDFELVVAGKGPLEDRFHEAAAKNPRVRMLGYIQGDLKTQTFTDADYVLVPSLWYENAPVVIVEAAAYGCGVIGSDIGALPEFIEHERTGLLFEPGNADALAATMTRVIREPAMVERFADNAQSLVARSSVQTMVDAYLEQYSALLRQPA